MSNDSGDPTTRPDGKIVSDWYLSHDITTGHVTVK